MKINAASTALSLWLSLLGFQSIRFLWFMFLVRTNGLVSYLVLCIGGTLYLEWCVFGWIVKKHGFPPVGDSPFAIATARPEPSSWNPLRWNLHAALSPVFFLLVVIPALWFVEFVEPGRLFRDGPSIGPIALRELTLPTDAGAIEFSDGHVHHAIGGAVDYTMARSVTKVYYADPFGDDTWDASLPVRVWVIHEEDEQITQAHRFAYVIAKHHVHRMAYQKAVENSESRFKTRSAEDAIVVRLDSRPPIWLHGPSYGMVLALLYLVSGLYTGTYAYRLVYAN